MKAGWIQEGEELPVLSSVAKLESEEVDLDNVADPATGPRLRHAPRHPCFP